MNSNLVKLNYCSKLILAPMVRAGTLPMRLLALDFGADIVYCEELIDWRLLRSSRIINDVLGTVDYIDHSDGTVVFRTCSREKDKLVLQLGTSDAQRALKVAQIVKEDVAAIDINMGCPKEFSIKGGMGAALMSQPDKAIEILSTLVNAQINKPITCKIRIFTDLEATLNFCRRLESTGISAIAVHGRTRDERPQHDNHNDYIKKIAETLTIPVIANGGSKEIETYNDIKKFQKETGCSSIMLARAAQWNCSIFDPKGKVSKDSLIQSYLRYSIDYDNAPANTKYCIQNMLRELQETAKGKQFLETQTLEQMADLWDLGDYCRAKQLEYKEQGLQNRWNLTPLLGTSKKRKFEENEDIIEMQLAFIRNAYNANEDLPKTKLLNWSRKNHHRPPVYKTEQHEKLFKSVVTVVGKEYSSTFWEKNKRWAEHSAALVSLYSLGLIKKDFLIETGSMVL